MYTETIESAANSSVSNVLLVRRLNAKRYSRHYLVSALKTRVPNACSRLVGLPSVGGAE